MFKRKGENMAKYGYVRVSTRGQAKDGNSLEAQSKAVSDAGAVTVFTDRYTGTKTDRPALNDLLSRLKAGDTLIVTKLDRIARSTSQGIELIESLIKKGVIIHILNMGIMDDTATGKLVRTIFLAFAEFEREMIVERTQEGKNIAKQKDGFREGRPNKFSRAQMEHALSLLDEHSYTEVSKMTGISKSTLIRHKKNKEK